MSTANTLANNAGRKLEAEAEEKVKRNEPPEAVAKAAAEPALQPNDKPLQSYAKYQTDVFDVLRESIKMEGDMFAFGEPTSNIIKLMSKIYHENIIRLLNNLSDIENKEPHVDANGNRDDRLKCMFGIMQDSNGELFVTISESPGFDDVMNSATDADFMNKRTMMLHLLKAANVKVNFIEEKNFGIKTVFNEEIRWRKGPGGGANWDTLPNYTEIQEKIKEKKLNEVMFLNKTGVNDNINIYHPSIRGKNEKQMEVYWVDSWEYLRNRKKNPTFQPFKKYKLSKNKTTWQAECNNGHLCTESKLFAYAVNNDISPSSFVAYWIGNELPPENHIIRGYCYRTIPVPEEIDSLKPEDKKSIANGKLRIYDTNLAKKIRKEQALLYKLAKRCYDTVTDIEPYTSLYTGNKSLFLNIFKNIVQPCAVACPGCFANIQNYKSGTMTLWNTSDCYVSRRVSRGGTRRKGRKGRKYTHKHKH